MTGSFKVLRGQKNRGDEHLKKLFRLRLIRHHGGVKEMPMLQF